jgi:hypothetical protein
LERQPEGTGLGLAVLALAVVGALFVLTVMRERGSAAPASEA